MNDYLSRQRNENVYLRHQLTITQVSPLVYAGDCSGCDWKMIGDDILGPQRIARAHDRHLLEMMNDGRDDPT